jgi:predicted nucleotidyltransferase
MAMFAAPDLASAGDYLDRLFGLDALWLFGSRAAGRARAGSDVDLAGLFRRSPSPLELLEAQAELGGRFGIELDLIDLDRASPILAMQVLRHGRLLVDRDPRRRAAFVTRTVSMYEDLKIDRRGTEQALLRRMAHGRS